MGSKVPPTVPLTEAQKQVVSDNLGLAYYAVSRICRRHTDIPTDEALSVAFLALIRSSQVFDPDRGATFATCFFWQVRASVSKYRRCVIPAGFKRSDGRTPPKTRPVSPDLMARFIDDRYGLKNG